jgi:hypothetical protein
MLSVTGLFGSAGVSAHAESRLPGKIVAAAVEAETSAIKRRRVISCSRLSQRELLVLEGESDIFRGVRAILSRFHRLLYDRLPQADLAEVDRKRGYDLIFLPFGDGSVSKRRNRPARTKPQVSISMAQSVER